MDLVEGWFVAGRGDGLQASVVVGELLKNGGLWCSPVAKTSSPISSALVASAIAALIRSCSVGVTPVIGSGVMSPTVKMPNCMTAPK